MCLSVCLCERAGRLSHSVPCGAGTFSKVDVKPLRITCHISSHPAGDTRQEGSGEAESCGAIAAVTACTHAHTHTHAHPHACIHVHLHNNIPNFFRCISQNFLSRAAASQNNGMRMDANVFAGAVA